MSTFFRALERAEQERALQRSAPASAPTTESATAPPGALSTPISDPNGPSGDARPGLISVFKRPEKAATPVVEERAVDIEEHLVSLLAPMSFEAEQYRALRHVIEQLRQSAELSVIAVSSPDAADGKTTTAINLAGTLAQAVDSRVLIVDADLRGANVAAHLGFDDQEFPGFVEAILDTRLTLDAVVQSHAHLNLSAICAGRGPSAPYEVLKSPRAAELLAEARRRYDYVIVDTPPLVSAPESRVIEKYVDGFLIVVGAHRTPRRLVEEALNLVEPAKILGMVFNGDDRHLSKYTDVTRRRRIARSSTRRGQTALGE
jgi:capsular exopolysaccharide synthesis family protein